MSSSSGPARQSPSGAATGGPHPGHRHANPENDRPGTADGDHGIHTIRADGLHRGWNGIHYKTGLSAKNVPARELSMNVARIPPGGVAFAHIHVDFEVMLYILAGTVRHDFGPHLRHSIVNEAGDFIFIEPGVPHEVVNVSNREDVVAVVARSDASEWENIVDYDRESGRATAEPATLEPAAPEPATAKRTASPTGESSARSP